MFLIPMLMLLCARAYLCISPQFSHVSAYLAASPLVPVGWASIVVPEIWIRIAYLLWFLSWSTPFLDSILRFVLEIPMFDPFLSFFVHWIPMFVVWVRGAEWCPHHGPIGMVSVCCRRGPDFAAGALGGRRHGPRQATVCEDSGEKRLEFREQKFSAGRVCLAHKSTVFLYLLVVSIHHECGLNRVKSIQIPICLGEIHRFDCFG